MFGESDSVELSGNSARLSTRRSTLTTKDQKLETLRKALSLFSPGSWAQHNGTWAIQVVQSLRPKNNDVVIVRKKDGSLQPFTLTESIGSKTDKNGVVYELFTGQTANL